MDKKEIDKIWKEYSYFQIDPDGQHRRMTKIGFLQAIQKLGIKIKEK